MPQTLRGTPICCQGKVRMSQATDEKCKVELNQKSADELEVHSLLSAAKPLVPSLPSDTASPLQPQLIETPL